MSEASLDGNFYVTFGMVVSVRPADVQTVRAAIEAAGGMIVYETVKVEDLYLLRRSQVEQILNGDLSPLREIHKKKQERRRLEKK